MAETPTLYEWTGGVSLSALLAYLDRPAAAAWRRFVRGSAVRVRRPVLDHVSLDVELAP